MQYPQNLQVASGASGVGVVNVVLVAPPVLGPSLRYRVWKFSGACFSGFAAATIRMGLTNIAGSTFDAISFHSTTASFGMIIPGGLLFAVNDAPRINALASVGTANLYLGSIMYTIETV